VAEVKYYLDENIAKSVLKGLGRKGIDAVLVTDVGMRTKSDIEHIQKALELERVIVTFDNDFLKLNNEGITHAGIAFFQDSYTSVGDMIRDLELLYQVMDAEDMFNHVEYL